MKAIWPTPGPIDEALVSSSVYLMDIAHEFRIRYKNFIAAKSKVNFKKSLKSSLFIVFISFAYLKASTVKSKDKEAPAQPAAPPAITGATIYVSKTFPQWQQLILDSLKKLYSVSMI